MKQSQQYQERLNELSRDFSSLPDKPEETPESTLAALWSFAAGHALSAEKALEHPLEALTENQSVLFDDSIQRWKQGEPLAHITGRQAFFGIELQVSSEALVPRKETELLAKCAIEKTPRDDAKVIDICTGCGNLPLAIALHRPKAKVYGADLSNDAVELAKRNAEFCGLSNSVEFFAGDLFAPFDGLNLEESIDLITCNPPYISSKKVSEMAKEISEHEPSLAFDGGPFGISILQKVIKQAPKLLKTGGWLIYEVGLGQGPSLVKKMERSNDYSYVTSFCDKEDNIRVIAARK
jgi:release factor glutamine methyltransferase